MTGRIPPFLQVELADDYIFCPEPSVIHGEAESLPAVAPEGEGGEAEC